MEQPHNVTYRTLTFSREQLGKYGSESYASVTVVRDREPRVTNASPAGRKAHPARLVVRFQSRNPLMRDQIAEPPARPRQAPNADSG